MKTFHGLKRGSALFVPCRTRRISAVLKHPLLKEGGLLSPLVASLAQWHLLDDPEEGLGSGLMEALKAALREADGLKHALGQVSWNFFYLFNNSVDRFSFITPWSHNKREDNRMCLLISLYTVVIYLGASWIMYIPIPVLFMYLCFVRHRIAIVGRNRRHVQHTRCCVVSNLSFSLHLSSLFPLRVAHKAKEKYVIISVVFIPGCGWSIVCKW